MTKRTPNPLAELRNIHKVVCPRHLKGAKKALWDKFIQQHAQGMLDGSTFKEQFAWAQRHLGLTCGVDTFRNNVNRAVEQLAD
jgi:hypothetical protein